MKIRLGGAVTLEAQREIVQWIARDKGSQQRDPVEIASAYMPPKNEAFCVKTGDIAVEHSQDKRFAAKKCNAREPPPRNLSSKSHIWAALCGRLWESAVGWEQKIESCVDVRNGYRSGSSVESWQITRGLAEGLQAAITVERAVRETALYISDKPSTSGSCFAHTLKYGCKLWIKQRAWKGQITSKSDDLGAHYSFYPGHSIWSQSPRSRLYVDMRSRLRTIFLIGQDPSAGHSIALNSVALETPLIPDPGCPKLRKILE
ncbi:hypothetical protein K438DRAFT_1932443 [Mycena galopus ATCC 62051]|nr:hypothetical protein K438DRAFT_1932443 [Mycena galopus ATCC 62051]